MKTANKPSSLAAYCCSWLFLAASLPAADTTSNLTAYWTFNQGSVADTTGNGYNGTPTNVSAAPDRSGSSTGALLFDGSSSSVEITKTLALQTQQTFAAWIKPASVSVIQPIFEKAVSGYGGELEYELYINSTGKLVLEVNTDNGAAGSISSPISSTPLTAGQWIHVAGVIDQANNQVLLYLNGTLVATSSMGGRNVRNQNYPLRIGRRIGNQAIASFNGVIDDVRVYGRALSTVDMAALADPLVIGNLRSSWPFSGGSVADSSGNGYNGTAQNVTATADRNLAASSALQFNGATSAVEVTSTFAMQGQQTYIAWVKPSSTATEQPVVEKASAGYSSEMDLEMMVRDDGKASFAVCLDDGGAGVLVQAVSTTALPAGQWSMLAGVVNQASHQIQIYVNGALSGTAAMGGRSIRNGNRPFRIGRRIGNQLSGYFNGCIDDVSIYDISLTSADFKTLVGSLTSSATTLHGDGRHGAYTLTGYMTVEQLYQAVRSPSDPANYDPADPNAVPQFRSLTLSNNATLTATAWNGTQGGNVTLKVQGLLSVAAGSSIAVDGLGNQAGPGAGGTGPKIYNNGTGTYDTRGGGGGGFGTNGTSGGNFTNSGGGGGGIYGDAQLSTVLMGSGGGNSGNSDPGGRGGGNITLNAGRLRVTGTLSANGAGGSLGVAGGGGGSGGAIKTHAVFAEIGSNLIQGSGGAGGGSQYQGNSWIGGNGGLGRIRVELSQSAAVTTNPAASLLVNAATDQDSDNITDIIEWGANTDVPKDSDNDGLPDYLDSDSNNNGIPDAVELDSNGLTRTTDSGNDGIPDYWESFYGLSPSSANAHPPGDGLSYLQKYQMGLNPLLTDSDGDGISDYDSVFTYGTNALKNDSDGDGMPDGWEIAHGLNARVNDAGDDADLDGLSNLEEYIAGTDPQSGFSNGATLDDTSRIKGETRQYMAFDGNDRLVGVVYSTGIALSYLYDGNGNLIRQKTVTADADHDGLPDMWELAFGLNPNNATGDDGALGDPDKDSWTNYQEWKSSTHPHDASSHPNTQSTPASQLRETPALAQLFPSSSTLSGLPVLNTRLWDGEGNAAKVYAQYYDTATQQWKNATLNNLDGSAYTGTSTASALPGGSAHTLVWNAYQDLGSSFNGSTLLRVRADDAFSTGAWSQPTSYNVNVNGTNNALLASLSLSGVTLSPAFSPGTTSYSGTVPFATTGTTVAAVALGSGAVVAGTGSQTLAMGDNTVNVTVTAADGVNQQTYTVEVHVRSNDASLAALSLSGVTLSPSFNSGTTNYLATVHTTTSSTTVSATTTNAAAVVTGTGVKALAPGGNAIALTVTAEDGNSQTYTVNVTQAAAMNGDLDQIFAPTADGNVNAIALQPDGKLIAGGAFNTFGGQPRSLLASLNADGSLDTTFNPSLDGTVVHAIAMQADGKILVGGDFTACTGQTRNRLARLNADGTLDATFNPNADGEVFAVMQQGDGKILVGGAFTNIGGLARSRIARLNADGTADAAFNPGADDVTWALAVQPDGKILVGGKFSHVSGNARSHLARLNADGTLDAAFNPGAGNDVNAITVQPDGKLLVGGAFTTLAGTSCSSVGRLNTDGTLDAGFNPAASAEVDAFALTADGKILLAGDFTALGSISRVRLARLNADGTVDGSFNQDADARVSALALQTDGAVWIGGGFSNVSGTARTKIARLANAPATQSVTASATGRTLLWSRSGSSADVGRATFEKSMDASTWTLLGSGSRVGSSSAWSLTGLALPVSQPFFIRARGQPPQAGGSSGGGQSLYEGSASITLTPVPEITVEQPAGTSLVDGAASVDFGANPAATQVERSFILRNTGTADLTGIVASITSGGGDFSLSTAPASTLAAGGSTTLKVTLTTSASAAGTRSGHLSIASNDTERTPFDVALTALTQAPQMVVEQPAGTSLVDGSSSVVFGSALMGSSVSKTFTIKNTGNANLTGLGITIDGTNASDFSVTSAPTPPVTGPSGSTAFTLRFAPTASGAKSAVLHIANNDTSTASSYDIALTGRAFVAAADDDGDGISNATELNLAAFGFDAMSNDSTRLTQLRTNGLYQASDMQTLALGSPVLTRDATTGHFHINVNLQRSLNLTTWTPLTGFTPTLVAPTGTLDIDIPPDGTNVQFFRVMGAKP